MNPSLISWLWRGKGSAWDKRLGQTCRGLVLLRHAQLCNLGLVDEPLCVRLLFRKMMMMMCQPTGQQGPVEGSRVQWRAAPGAGKPDACSMLGALPSKGSHGRQEAGGLPWGGAWALSERVLLVIFNLEACQLSSEVIRGPVTAGLVW